MFNNNDNNKNNYNKNNNYDKNVNNTPDTEKNPPVRARLIDRACGRESFALKPNSCLRFIRSCRRASPRRIRHTSSFQEPMQLCNA